MATLPRSLLRYGRPKVRRGGNYQRSYRAGVPESDGAGAGLFCGAGVGAGAVGAVPVVVPGCTLRAGGGEAAGVFAVVLVGEDDVVAVLVEVCAMPYRTAPTINSAAIA